LPSSPTTIEVADHPGSILVSRRFD
jgi:hypothetical protein